jgi:multiple sugar transport system permease protein
MAKKVANHSSSSRVVSTSNMGILNGFQGFRRYLFLIPAIAVTMFILLYTIFRTVYLSFTNSEGLSPYKLIGFKNYLHFLHDPILIRTMTNVGIWTIGTLLLPVLLGLFIAIIANGIRASGVYRFIFLLPYVLSGVAVGSIWIWIFRSDGILNKTLKNFGLNSWAHSWLIEWPQNTIAMIIASTWATTGLVIVLFTVGLQAIPKQTVEAGLLDGAKGWTMFRFILWPQLKYIRAVVIGTTLANSLRTFDIVWTMTKGGPYQSSETLAVSMYRETFLINRIGYGASISVLLGVLVVSISFLALRRGLKVEK